MGKLGRIAIVQASEETGLPLVQVKKKINGSAVGELIPQQQNYLIDDYENVYTPYKVVFSGCFANVVLGNCWKEKDKPVYLETRAFFANQSGPLVAAFGAQSLQNDITFNDIKGNNLYIRVSDATPQFEFIEKGAQQEPAPHPYGHIYVHSFYDGCPEEGDIQIYEVHSAEVEVRVKYQQTVAEAALEELTTPRDDACVIL